MEHIAGAKKRILLVGAVIMPIYFISTLYNVINKGMYTTNKTSIASIANNHTFASLTNISYNQNLQPLHSKEEEINILILTSFRSGSSLAGSIFAANPDIFYIFEPLGIFGNVPTHRKSTLGCVIKPLKHCMMWLYNCEINKFLQNGYKIIPTRKGWAGVMFQQAASDNLVPIQDLHQWDRICKKNYKHIAAKIIRERKLEHAVPLMQHGVKVLYLVRDPRSVYYSRSRFAPKPKAGDIVKECLKHTKNMEYLHSITKDSDKMQRLFQEYFRVIRYEDLSRDFWSYTQKIYKFLDLSIPKRVEEFTKSQQYVDLWHPIKFDDEDNILVQNTSYNVPPSQNLTEMRKLDTWRITLNFNKIKNVQTVCKKHMDNFGYNVLQDFKMVKDKEWNSIKDIPDIFPYKL